MSFSTYVPSHFYPNKVFLKGSDVLGGQHRNRDADTSVKGWKESHMSQRLLGKGLRLMSYTGPDAGLGELSPVQGTCLTVFGPNAQDSIRSLSQFFLKS